MEEATIKVLWVIAIAASALFVLRLAVMFMFGDGHGGGHADGGDAGVGHPGHDHAPDLGGHDTSHDLRLISTYTITAFLMMGSWTALACHDSFGYSLGISLAIGGGIGFAFMYLVAFMLSRVSALEEDGTLRNFDPRGLRGECYVTIPPAGTGEGQVRLEVKGRMKVFRAVNEEAQTIDSFKAIQVTGMTTDRVMRVRAAQ